MQRLVILLTALVLVSASAESGRTNLIAAVHRETARYEASPHDNERRERSLDLDARIGELVDGLLLLHEAPLPTPLRAGRPFLDAFTAHAREGSLGPPLRALDLTRRLQTVRCSYMIESAPFLALSADVRQRVYRQIRITLDDPASGISSTDRQDVLEMLSSLESTGK